VEDWASNIDILSEKVGIIPEYYDKSTKQMIVSSTQTKAALLEAMGIKVKTREDVLDAIKRVEFAKYNSIVEPVYVFRTDGFPISIDININQKIQETLVCWECVEENGQVTSGCVNLEEMDVVDVKKIDSEKFEKRKLILPIKPPIGYHDLKISFGSEESKSKLIIVPVKTFMPESMKEHDKVWGIPVQLYALRSKKNWGIGDFSDLIKFIEIASDAGAGVIGLNPINVLCLDNPEAASPYSSNSRIFKNPLYIAVEEVEEYQTSEKIKEYVSSEDFKAKLKAVRQSMVVKYREVAELKMNAFRLMYAEFKSNYYSGTELSNRAKSFEDFCESKGEILHNLAVYQMLTVYMKKKFDVDGWRNWPMDFHNPKNRMVKELAREFADEIKFYKYLQWIADGQFAKAGLACWKSNMSIGLYEDLAVGVNYQSSETWSSQSLFLENVTVGAPPDKFNPKGQGWGLAGFCPYAMKKDAYQFFRRILQSNMRRSGALRVDHVMGLLRLYLIPEGEKGSYVSYPQDDLYGIIALESHRHSCVIVGEDLGTVPKGFRDEMHSRGIMSLKMLWGEREKDGSFKSPKDSQKLAAIGAGTHDLPTLHAMWKGADIELFSDYDLFRTPEDKEKAIKDRVKERTWLLEALEREGFAPKDSSLEGDLTSGKLVPKWLSVAVYSFMASSNCHIALVQLEDILGQVRQMNLPGTDMEYPNWRHKNKVSIETLATDERFVAVAEAMRKIRGNGKVA
jgi:(1->4)-alpha-D-glucan 1-alpha-D-glucosylmutase